MELLKNEEMVVEPDGRSPIYSHQKSYSPDVHAICHHSGQYLTAAETNPTARLILREQHDFPGLPRLDKAFKKAAHAAQYEHWVWSKPGIQGTLFLLSGLLVLYLAYRVQQLSAFMVGGIWFGLYWLVLIMAGLGGLGLAGYGMYLILQRDAIFHKRAAGMSPALPDFPVECTYEIEVTETIEAELGNAIMYPDTVARFNGRIIATLNPLQNDLETLTEYRRQYRNYFVGEWVTAGAIGMTGATGITFLNNHIDFDHRLVLRVPSANLEMDGTTDTYKPLKVTSDYTVTPAEIFPQADGLTLFPLQCEPRLSLTDSRSLELHFSWLGPQPAPTLLLEECILGTVEKIPEDLLPVQVIHGRYDPTVNAERVIWRNLPFQETQEKTHLLLQLQFAKPPLKCLTNIVGTYRVRLESLVSHLEIHEKHVWTAWGLNAAAEDSFIHRAAVIHGRLVINPQRLAQEHEHVTDTPPIVCCLPPDERTVARVMNVLLDNGFDVQSVIQSPPRLHPSGRLDAQLRYWDISGRSYDSGTLEAIDLHTIISGYEPTSQVSSKKSIEPRTQIDIRLRCLHDPRHRFTAEHADTLLIGLKNRIQTDLGQLE